ncbi:MAG: VWA domain-containing protein, partial [Duodenibacillus sp.]|nr:VWA domain-containing protein [Duodenibacillus sp.]
MKSAFARSLPLTAAAFGERFGVDIVIGGRRAATDGRRIALPVLGEGCPCRDNAVLGFLMHE